MSKISIVRILTGAMLLLSIASCEQITSTKRPLRLGTPDDQCKFPSSKAVAKLYIDDGSLSISSTRYTVTYQDENTSEAFIFASASSPWVESIYCNQDSLVLAGFPEDEPITLELSWIRNELIKAPLRIYKGKLESLEYASQVRGWKRVSVPTITPSSP